LPAVADTENLHRVRAALAEYEALAAHAQAVLRGIETTEAFEGAGAVVE
jgi:hypothetical protein